MKPNTNPDRPDLAANAVKHGFRAEKYIDSQIVQDAERLRAALVEIHQPDSTEEIDILQDLAIAQARLNSVQRGFDNSRAHDRARARHAFEKLGREECIETLEKSARMALLNFQTLGDTYEGVAWIVRCWTRFVEHLGPNHPGISFEDATFACNALGSHWKIALLTAKGAWLMARFVNAAADPREELNRWIQASGGTGDASRARWYVDKTPGREACRRELLTEGQAQLDRWTLRLNELRPDYRTAAETAADRLAGIEPGDEDQMGRFRLQLRYLATARNEVNRLQRRLDAIKKSRPLYQLRADRKAERQREKPTDRRQQITPGETPADELQTTQPESLAAPLPNGAEPVEPGPFPIAPMAAEMQSPATSPDDCLETDFVQTGVTEIEIATEAESTDEPDAADDAHNPTQFDIESQVTAELPNGLASAIAIAASAFAACEKDTNIPPGRQAGALTGQPEAFLAALSVDDGASEAPEMLEETRESEASQAPLASREPGGP